MILYCLFGRAPRAECRTWIVSPTESIQPAIDAAANGDTILVSSGTYSESINFVGKAISLIAPSGPEATAIQGSPSGPVVTFDHDEGRECLLKGFTISGGKEGVLVYGAEPVISGNVVRDNIRGMHITDASGSGPQRSPLIHDNLVTSNHSNGGGGGINIIGDMTPQIFGNRIIDNSTGVGDGGGIRAMVTDGGMLIAGNLIVGNVADDHGGGMVVAIVSDFSESRSVEISDNVIIDNVALGNGDFVSAGGGLACYSITGPIRNNTFVHNSGYGGEWFCGNLAIDTFAQITTEVTGNIIANAGAGGGVGIYRDVTVQASNNLLWNNSPQDIVIPGSANVLENEDIYADPLLCNESGGDGSVSVYSPCLSSLGGVIGAIEAPGCNRTPVARTTWGRLKTFYGQ